MRLLPCGDLAILVELEDADERRRLDATLRATHLAGVTEHVPADRTVLVLVERSSELARVAADLRRLTLHEPATESGVEPVTIPVVYDGPDLADVATHLGLATEEVVTRHTGQLWTVEFAGFAPGFGYLTGSDRNLDVPRRETPRTRVPPGSVGLAGTYSGVYPRPSPGGWQLVGHTDLAMWDATRDPPALLSPGREVRFVEARP